MKVLIRRFTLPVFAAWLLHMGLWMVAIALELPFLSMLFGMRNWFVEHFAAGNNFGLEEVSWGIPYTSMQVAEGLIPVALGLLLGFWILHRKRQKKALA